MASDHDGGGSTAIQRSPKGPRHEPATTANYTAPGSRSAARTLVNTPSPAAEGIGTVYPDVPRSLR